MEKQLWDSKHPKVQKTSSAFCASSSDQFKLVELSRTLVWRVAGKRPAFVVSMILSLRLKNIWLFGIKPQALRLDGNKQSIVGNSLVADKLWKRFSQVVRYHVRVKLKK